MTTELDIGPLSWVKGEIDLALERATSDLKAHASDPQGKALGKTVASLHQAHGALAVVGLDGITEFAHGIERLITALEQGRLPHGSDAFTTAINAALAGIVALRSYLDDLMAGQPDQPLRLFPSYKAMAVATGGPPPSPEILFSPDLSQRPPKREKEIALLAPDALAARLKAARLGFERGLLKWIKNDNKGAAEMKVSIAMIEATFTTPAERAYWWICLGVLDGLAAGGLDGVAEVKPFALKLGAQVKKLTEGVTEAGDHAMIAALYLATVASKGGEQLGVVRAAYRLDDLLPGAAEDDAKRLLPHLRRLRELLAAAKDDWNRFSAGTIAALPPFHERISKIAEEGTATGQSDYICLTTALLDLTNQLRRDPSRHNDSLALEVATALLLAETALDDFQGLGAEFAGLVETLIARLDAATQGEPLDALDLPALETMSQRAQEKLLTESVIREIRNNLGAIEQALDSFFRDPSRKEGLDSVMGPIRQVEGALVMLGQGRANEVLRECRQAVERFAAPDYATEAGEFEDLAKKFAALSFFIEQFQTGKADIDSLLHPAAAPTAAEEPAAVEETVAAEQAPLAALSETPPAAAPEAPIETASETPPGEDTDDDLLKVFLAEAHDVLATMAEHLPKLHENPSAQEPLAALRRGFHTLKGSGRMVGLNALGDTAWAVEQVMNNWLDSGRPVTPGLEAMLDQACALFKDAVARIESREDDGSSGPTAAMSALIKQCEVLEQAPDLAPAPPEAPPAEAETSESTETAEILAFPTAQTIRVGDLDVADTLYRLYLDETRGHLATLQEHLGLEAVPAADAIRAAHTTASISAATGFTAIHTLARALETALERLAAVEALPSETQRLIFARSAGALDGMVGAIAERRLPTEEAALIAELQTIAFEPTTPEASAEPGLPEVNLVPVDRRTQRIKDEIDVQLLPLFLEESVDLMASIGEGLRAWRQSPSDEQTANALKRALHTLKGSARMAGAMRCGELLHGMESRIEQAAAQRNVQPATIDDLEMSFDRVATMIDHLRNPDSAPPGDEPLSQEESVAVEVVREQAAAIGQAAPHAAVPLAEQSPQILLRIRANLVDQFVNEAGEIAIARARIERELLDLETSLADLTDNVARLRSQLREIEIYADSKLQSQQELSNENTAKFDPLELDRFTRFQEVARMMAESVNDVATVQQTLQGNLDNANTSLAAQARLNRDLSLRLMSVRRVSFNSLAERLHRVVRQAAKDADKRANLDIRQGQTELDRSMLDALAGPLEHLVRNCIAHGLEDRGGRAAAGKSEIGQISISLAQEGNEIVIVIADDGAGLDYPKIRQRGIEREFFTEDTAPASGDTAALGQLIFQPGFTTAKELTTLSGRGVGMDVVKNVAASLGGRLNVSSVSEQGAVFSLTLPLTLAITQAVLVTANHRSYAIPASMIEQASEHKLDSIEKIRSEGGLDWMGQRYPWRYLPELLNEAEATPSTARRHWLLLIKGGSERLALEVDGLTSNQEIVVKPLGPQLSRVTGLAGATVLADGEIVLILNPIALLALAREQHREATALTATTVVRREIAAKTRGAAVIMVVDDSLTVRKIGSRLLARHGYEVLTAKDGVDALEQLDQTIPDVMLVDIEMPRLDGFGLTRAVRADERLKQIPIIMITSRSGDKHRQFAAEIGVNHFLGKPYDETELLALVAKFIDK